MKSSVIEHVDLSPFTALFKDVCAWDPALHSDLLRDFVRLERFVKLEGVSFVLVTMPSACKILDRALSRGYLNPFDLPRQFGRIRNGYRVFLSCLFRKIFDEEGKLSSSDVNSIFFLRTALCLYKKLQVQCRDDAKLRAVDEFYRIESGMRSPNSKWMFDNAEFDPHGNTLHLADGLTGIDTGLLKDLVPSDYVRKPLVDTFQEVCDAVMCRFPLLVPEDVYPKHGPGAVADMKNGEDKYILPYWPDKLSNVFPPEQFAQHREDLHMETMIERSPHELPSRLLAVAKTFDKPRLIASEPVAHQFIQLGLMGWIRNSLPSPLRKCIDFHSQEPSRAAAMRASRNGKSATVDLSSASDRLSCWVVERAFRKAPSLLRALHACRTRLLINATGVGFQEAICLKKYACQGNGTTFPVQTIIYAMAAIAVIIDIRRQRVNWTTISNCCEEIQVYGDDIIMPSFGVSDLDALLTFMGLKVNSDKTHYSGMFRESCGLDAYAGFDVTPVYLTHLSVGDSAEDIQSWIDVSNNAYHKGCLNLSSWIIDRLPQSIRKYIPVTTEELSCLTIHTYTGSYYPMPTRYNESLHRMEVQALVPVTRCKVKKRDSYLDLLQFFVERPSPEDHWSAGVKGRVALRLAKRWVPIY